MYLVGRFHPFYKPRKPLGKQRYSSDLFEDVGTRRVEGLASRPGRFSPRERRGTHFTAGWVGPRAGMDRCGKPRPPPGFDSLTVQPVTNRYNEDTFDVSNTNFHQCGK
jgi:hypothetical protein